MNEQKELEGLQELEPREKGENDFVEAYSDVGGLRVQEKEEEMEFLWQTDSDFRDVLEAVESLYRRRNGIQVLDKNHDNGELSHSKVREYVLEGPLEGRTSTEVGDWTDHYLIQVCGSDFTVSWDKKGEEEDYRVRVMTQGSGLAPFANTYISTVGSEDAEKVVEDVWNEFYSEPRSFPGFWNPSGRYD